MTVKITGSDAVEMDAYTKTFNSDGTSELVEEFAGSKAKVEAAYDAALGSANLANASLRVQKGTGTLSVTYQSQQGTSEEEAEVTPAEWSFDVLEIVRPLASHPYFQTKYIPESGYEISELLAYVETLIAKGEPFASPPQTSAYDAWLKRYYAMKCAGVESYTAVGLQLTKTYVTSSPFACASAYYGISRVDPLDNIDPPELIYACMFAVESITGYTSDDPATVQYAAGAWEWLKKAPQLQSAGNENSNTVRITESWWGLDTWSKVLYEGGTWDPGSNI